MQKIEYRETESLCREYLHIFENNLSKIQEEWDTFRNNVRGFLIFPQKVEDILLAKFEDLARMYSVYKDLEILNENDLKIRTIFKYKGYWQSRITEFFKVHSETMGINTCCYCETAYINTYQTGNRKRSHFDLDHFFPKNACPILALSFYNLIPSCTVCNERLKRNDILGDNINEWLLLSPSSCLYAFDEKVKMRILPKQEAYHCMRYQDNPDKFAIHFETTSPEYEKEIAIFHLNERYEFHKCEALRLLDLKQDYPDSHINMISIILGQSPDMIKENIFNKNFIHDNHRVLSKFYRDFL